MKKLLLILTLIVSATVTQGQLSGSKEKMKQLISENFALADTQYRYMMTLIPPGQMPQSFDEKNQKVISREITWWCTGFYPGSLWYIYDQTRNPELKAEAERALKVIEGNQFYTGNHDLGFMMYCSF